MGFLPTYPIILYPEVNSEKGKIISRSVCSNEFKPHTEYVVPQRKNFNLYRLRLGIKVIRWVGYLFSGIILFLMSRDILQGEYYSLISGFFILAIKTGIIWLLEQGLASFEAAALEDRAEVERQYWQNLKKSNQDYLAQVEAQTFRQKSLQSFGKKKDLVKNFTTKLVYTRGIQQVNYIKGVSENYFEKYLRKYFSDCEISSDYFVLNDKIGYSSDFSLLPPRKEVAIDIEIDEPYQGKSKEPHHCQDEGKDHRRNLYFLKRGWIVVRFSEYQVVLYPDGCCREIAKVLAKYNINQYLEAFADIPELQSAQSWTIEDARVLASRKFREKYLEEAGIFNF